MYRCPSAAAEHILFPCVSMLARAARMDVVAVGVRRSDHQEVKS